MRLNKSAYKVLRELVNRAKAAQKKGKGIQMNTMKLRLALPLFVALAYSPAQTWAAPVLGSTLETFSVLGASTVTNTGATVVTGNLGVSPGTAVTGFPPGGVVGGSIHAGDAFAALAQGDLTNARTSLGLMAGTSNLTGTNLGGLTLTSGVYDFDSSAQLTGTLTLDGGGNANAFWVFRTESTLTTASNSSVIFTNMGSGPGSHAGLFWDVGSSATLGTNTSFEGNILALASITLNTGATIGCGRAAASTGAVTLDTNIIGGGCLGNLLGSNGLSGGLVVAGLPGTIPTPVPEPETYALLLGGLGLLGLVARRRKQKQPAA